MEVILQLTRDCNLACTYCYQLGRHRADAGMSAATALRAVELALEQGHSHVAVSYFGGEPLLNRRAIEETLPKLRGFGASRGALVTAKVSTNGVLLDDSFAALARRFGLFVSLSTDGCPEAQDLGRSRKAGEGGGATSQDVERALAALVARRAPFCTYQVVTPQNARFFARSVDWLFERGSRVLITGLDFGAEWDDDSLAVLGKQYRALARRYVRWTRKGVSFYLAPFDGKIAAHTRGARERRRPGESQSCAAGVRQFAVDPDGALYPCVEFLGHDEFRIGHLDHGFDRERQHGVMARFGGKRPDECGSCGIRTRCATACACLNHRLTGKLREVDALVCAHEKLVTLAADRMGDALWKKKDRTFLDRQYDATHHALSAVEDWFHETIGGPKR